MTRHLAVVTLALALLAAPAAIGLPQSPTPQAEAVVDSDPEQAPAPAQEYIQFDFRGASLRTLVRFVAQLSNLIPIMPDAVVGQVTISSPRQLTLDDAHRVLRAVLDAHQFTLMRDDHFLRVIPKAESIQRSVDLFYGREPGQLPGDDRIVTQIIPLEHTRAAGLVTTLAPLISSTGNAFVSDDNNLLGITDSAANVRRLLGIVTHLDVERDIVTSTITRVYNIRYLKAIDVATALSIVFGLAGGPPGGGQQQPQATPGTTATPAAAPTSGGGTSESDARITPVEAANALVVTGDRALHAQVAETIAALDKRRRQVLIEVKIVEGTLSDEVSTGVNLLEFLFRTSTGLHQITGGANVTNPYLTYTLDSNQVDAVLTAAASTDRIQILSAPRVLTSDNQQAHIVVAQEEPILRSVTDLSTADSGPRTVSDFEYRDVGIELTVTPRINVDRDVDLEVAFSITSLLANVPLPGESFAPRIGKRLGSSNVTVMDGSTLVIGGLIKDDFRDQRNKVPVLGSLPLLGRLFSTVRQVKEQTELLVFITPYVAETNEESVQITLDATESMGERFPDARTETSKREQQQR